MRGESIIILKSYPDFNGDFWTVDSRWDVEYGRWKIMEHIVTAFLLGDWLAFPAVFNP